MDANVLVAGLKRNILLHLAEADFFRPRWSARILEEVDRALDRLGKPKEKRARLFRMLDQAFPEATVENWEVFEQCGVDLPDKDDRHVLAAAVKCDAEAIVTDNLKDFPTGVLSQFNIEPISADEFIADAIDLNQAEASAAMETMRRGFNAPNLTQEALLEKMRHAQLVMSASILCSTFTSQN